MKIRNVFVSGRNSLSQGRGHQLLIQHKTALDSSSHENIDMQVTPYRNRRLYLEICVYAYMYVAAIDDKGGHEFRRKQKGGYMGRFRGRNGNEKWYSYINLEKEKVFKKSLVLRVSGWSTVIGEGIFGNIIEASVHWSKNKSIYHRSYQNIGPVSV